MWLTMVCFEILNSKFRKSLKGNEVEIDHSIKKSLEQDPSRNISAMESIKCPTFENSFNTVFFKFHIS